MINFDGFDWGTSNQWYKDIISQEFSDRNLYLKYFDVSEGDIVVDLGASIGPFPYSIKNKNPKHIYCVEPSSEQLPTLKNNLQGSNFTIISKGISNKNGSNTFELYGNTNQIGQAESISFETFLQTYNIDKIDFLKTDCEGGEYDVFTIDNFCWLKENLGAAVGEWHLSTPELKQKFKEFRDVFLRLFPNHQVFSVDGVDIKWDLWNEHFIEYYNEVIIHINNKK
jgi:FkbM family methyltransferase